MSFSQPFPGPAKLLLTPKKGQFRVSVADYVGKDPGIAAWQVVTEWRHRGLPGPIQFKLCRWPKPTLERSGVLALLQCICGQLQFGSSLYNSPNVVLCEYDDETRQWLTNGLGGYVTVLRWVQFG